jgi:predicted transcriptional regulator
VPTFSITLSDAHYEQLEQLTKNSKTSKADHIRAAFEDYLERQSDTPKPDPAARRMVEVTEFVFAAIDEIYLGTFGEAKRETLLDTVAANLVAHHE